MKNIEVKLPKEQVSILIDALEDYQQSMKSKADIPFGMKKEDYHHKVFDITTLLALLKYEVSITLTEQQLDSFTADNGVDFPTWNDDDIVKTKTTLWDVVEKYYPNYDRCDDIALSEDLQKLLNKEQTYGSYADVLLHSDYDGDVDNPQIKIDADNLNKTIYEKTLTAFIEMIYKELGIGFHPDTPFSDYVSIKNESYYFTDEKAQELQTEFDLLTEQFSEDEMYEIINPFFEKYMSTTTTSSKQFTDKKTVFAFGTELVNALNDGNLDKAKILLLNSDGKLVYFRGDETPLEIIFAYDGWNAYKQLTAEEIKFFKENI